MEKKHIQSKKSIYRLARRKFPRLGVIAKHINEIWCMDLAYMDKLSVYNNGVKYLLVSVDVISRFVRVQTLTDKLAKTTKRAFVKMITDYRPKKVWVDQGTEFEGEFKKYCRDLGITIYHTFSETKAAYAERTIRSLKNIIYRFLEESESYRYLPKLQSFVKTLNTRIHKTIRMAPKNVTNGDVFKIIHSKISKFSKPKFRVNDYIRVSKKDIPFRKGYKPQFTDEIFKIVKIQTRNPPTYSIQDKDSLVIKGKFYEPEMIKYTT